MESREVAAGDATVTVRIDGPESKHTVLLLPGAGENGSIFDAVCERLHNSDLRTVVPESIGGLDETSTVALLDALKLPWVNLAGNREGAALAWLLAARTFGRFASLVVADCPHPAVADLDGLVRQADCPAIEMPTTLLIGSSLARPFADNSGRRVYSDYRVVQLDGVDSIPEAASAEMATEIVLRTSSW
ncbi:alpha/beta hydrolase [Rhodococcus sp. NPDC059234]|uniref:alpha/beta hydrolase n=1 Tax=Rhodococcus sp. NPDC059234 TaxID=3346781 RepID=UPI00366A7454